MGRVESQLLLLFHQSAMGYTAKKEVSIVLSHTASSSQVLPVCGASQGHEGDLKGDLVCGTAPLLAPSSFTQLVPKAYLILQHSQCPVYL